MASVSLGQHLPRPLWGEGEAAMHQMVANSTARADMQ
jgi:hypothetical protein